MARGMARGMAKVLSSATFSSDLIACRSTIDSIDMSHPSGTLLGLAASA